MIKQEISENKDCYHEFHDWNEMDQLINSIFDLSWLFSGCGIAFAVLWLICKKQYVTRGGVRAPMTATDVTQTGQTPQAPLNNQETPFAQSPQTSPPSYFESTSFSSAPGPNPLFGSQPMQAYPPGPPQNQYFGGGTGVGPNYSMQYGFQ